MAITAPEFISAQQVAAWNSTTTPRSAPNSGTFEVKKGDVLVAIGAIEHNGSTPTLGISGGSLTWTAQETQSTGAGTQAGCRAWTATVDADKSMSVSFSRTGGSSQNFGGAVLIFRKSTGVGSHISTNNGTSSGAPLVELTTGQENSAVVFIVVDWNAVTGTRTYRTTDAGAATEVVQYADGAIYGVHGAYHANAGTAAKKQLGLTAPSGERYVIAAVEVKGEEAGGETVYTEAGSGTITITGSISESVEATETGAGTIAVLGESSQALEATEAAEGVLEMSGSSVEQLEYTETAAGEASLTGSASEVLEFLESATGQIGVTGTASAMSEFIEAAEGSAILIGTKTEEFETEEEGEGESLTYVIEPLGIFHRTSEEPSEEELSLFARFLNLFRRDT